LQHKGWWCIRLLLLLLLRCCVQGSLLLSACGHRFEQWCAFKSRLLLLLGTWCQVTGCPGLLWLPDLLLCWL
jgi:hypothetical protein